VNNIIQEYTLRSLLIVTILFLCSCKTINKPIGMDDISNIVNINWILMSISGEAVLEGVEIRLKISDEGKINGNAGANSYYSHWQLNGYVIKSDRISATKKFRLKPQGVMGQETTYLKYLSNVTGWNIIDGDLFLYNGDKIILKYYPALSKQNM